MNDTPDAAAEMLGTDRQVALDRASHELCAGRPIILEGAEGPSLVAALDTISPSLFSVFRDMSRAALNLPAQQAHGLGLAGDHPVAIPLAGLEFEAALRFVTCPIIPDLNIRHKSSDLEAGIFELCRRAFLLPALLTMPMDAETLELTGVHRVAQGKLAMPLPSASQTFEIVSDAAVPLAGNIRTRFLVLRSRATPRDQVAIIVGKPDLSRPVPVWVHSACLTSDVFGSLTCDHDDRLRRAVEELCAVGGGVLLYLDREGRGIASEMRPYASWDADPGMLDANAAIGYGADDRRSQQAAAILIRLGYQRILLLTDNPGRATALRRAGLDVVDRDVGDGNRHYAPVQARQGGIVR